MYACIHICVMYILIQSCMYTRGLDHVIAQSRDIDSNTLVMDTEGYSNTRGQISKATYIVIANHGKRHGKQLKHTYIYYI